MTPNATPLRHVRPATTEEEKHLQWATVTSQSQFVGHFAYEQIRASFF